MRDMLSEREVLATVLSGAPVAEDFLLLPLTAFAPGPHEILATVLRDRLVRGIPIDPLVVAADARAATGTDHHAERVQAFVVECASHFPPAASWSYYLERVITCQTIRDGTYVGTHLVQRLGAEGLVDEPDEVTRLIQAARANLEAAVDGRTAATVEPPLSLAELLDGEEDPYDWLVPDLLERTDRVIITGFEGTGKSYLLAQMALTIAAGLHPFTGHPFRRDGCRVLVLDCENSRRQNRRRYSIVRRQVNQLREQNTLDPIDWSDAVRFVLRPEGIDLANVSEVARIEKAIAATAPDLVVAGPLYRMHRLNLNDETAAREIVEVLDRLRVKYHFALITEAHVGHVGETSGGRKLRPTGSSLFLRWPEFGYGLRAFGPGQAEEHPSTVEVVPWRGARDERDWPTHLKHSDYLPWIPCGTSTRTALHAV